MTRPATHFVGFRSDEYTRALRVWKPDFIHPKNDPRSRREIAPGDTVVFANGSEVAVSERNAPDYIEKEPEDDDYPDCE